MVHLMRTQRYESVSWIILQCSIHVHPQCTFFTWYFLWKAGPNSKNDKMTYSLILFHLMLCRCCYVYSEEATTNRMQLKKKTVVSNVKKHEPEKKELCFEFCHIKIWGLNKNHVVFLLYFHAVDWCLCLSTCPLTAVQYAVTLCNI